MSYWNTYYINHPDNPPSAFAQTVVKRIGSRVLDLGCGNGRDSLLFAQSSKVVAVDNATQALLSLQIARNAFNSMFDTDYLGLPLDIQTVHIDIITQKHILEPIVQHVSSIYTRFLLHTIPHEHQGALLDLLFNNMRKGAYIFIECRSDNGVSPDDTHARWLVSKDMVKHYLKKYQIEYMLCEECGLAPTDNEDPLIIRIIGMK